MPQTLSAHEAAALINPTDTFATGLGPAQPPALLKAMGERSDWVDLQVGAGLMTVGTSLFNNPAVTYTSGFYGPFERALADQGAKIDFVPVDFRRFEPILQALPPRVIATAAAQPDENGFCSLSLHAGATADELRRAGQNPDRLLIVEVSSSFPKTVGFGDYKHALHVDEIDVLIQSEEGPLAMPASEPDDLSKQIAAHAAKFIPDGATLQTGIGSIPGAIAQALADGPGTGYGIHTEMFTDGLMHLHKAGKVSNSHKGIFDGKSITTFAFGSRELYDWLDGNPDVAFLPVSQVNNPITIGQNQQMITINGALAVDQYGQIVADTIGGKQFSGIGGAEDFVSGPGLELNDRSLLCLPSTATVDGKIVSRIVNHFGPGAVITTPRHQLDTVVTEHGAVELRGKTLRQRAAALAEIAAPEFREQLLAEADEVGRKRYSE